MKINYKRMLDTFLSLTSIEGPSFDEGNIAAYVEGELKKLGCKTAFDKAGKVMPSTAKGNLFGSFKGNIKSAPFVLAAHLDTVNPCKGIKPIVKGGKVVSDGKTILGADDRAGIAIILEILRTLKESGANHPPVETLFTLCEESGMHGAKNIDITKLKGREGLILDNDNNDEIIVRAPQSFLIEVEVTGLAAHAGVAPEKGISALEVIAYALSIMKIGRIDKETVANFGIAEGGKNTNVVMPSMKIKGEARSLNSAKLKKQLDHMRSCFKKAEVKFTKKVEGKTVKPVIAFNAYEKYPMLNIPASSTLIKHISACAKECGVKVKTASSGGGYDANVLFGKGLFTPIIGIGYRSVHTTSEWLDIAMFNQTADIVLKTVITYRK